MKIPTGKARARQAKKIPHATDIHVGSQVRLHRMMLGVTQKKLAKQLGITFQQVQKYEKGTNRVSASRIQKISDVLAVPIPTFFQKAPPKGANGEPPSESSATEFVSTSQGVKLTRAFVRIKDERLRRSIIALVEALASED